jgi:hypothetical protein
MPEWAKVLAGCLALMLGASGPPIILEASRPGTLWQLDQPTDNHTIAAQPSIASDDAGYDHRPTSPNSEEASDWYTKPDWWIAGFTAALFFATTGLWVFTWLLWQSTRRAVIDGEKALNVAQSNAKAARDSADALPALERAYIFIDIEPEFVDTICFSFEVLGRASQRPGGDAAVVTPPPTILYQFINHGKTPAILKAASAEFHHWTDLPQQIHYFDKLLGREIAIRSGDTYPLPAERSVTSSEARFIALTGDIPVTRKFYQIGQPLTEPIDTNAARSIQSGDSFLWFYGRVIYEDVFRKHHETCFCWRYDGRLNSFEQYYRGGDDDNLNRRT